jgi:membrane protease subunit (stomatin/prohibitin family)
MAIVRAFTGAISGAFADQWKDIITVGQFDEHTVVMPGMLQQPSNGRGTHNKATDGVISNGSKIFVPENAAAFIFSQSGIEEIITIAGGYEYQSGQSTIFNGDGLGKSLIKQVADRVGYGGQTAEQKQVAFVNLREIRGIRFGTRSPLIYHDLFYGTDLEVTAFGAFSIKIIDAERFIRNYVPANINYYSFDDPKVRSQIISEFVQSFVVALNSLSFTYRISQLPSQANEIAVKIPDDNSNAGTWIDRFGFEVVQVGIETIELSPESKELVKQYSSKKMDWKAVEDVSQKSSNIAAQQKIAQGIQDHGLGDMPGMMLGMGMAQGLNPQNVAQVESKTAMSVDQQIETLKKLKELLDAGILSEDEFNIKKKDIMGL